MKQEKMPLSDVVGQVMSAVQMVWLRLSRTQPTPVSLKPLAFWDWDEPLHIAAQPDNRCNEIKGTEGLALTPDFCCFGFLGY